MMSKTFFTREKPAEVMKEAASIVPESFADVEEIVKRLKLKEGVVVDFDGIAPESAQRMLDFVCGAVFAMRGSIKKIKKRAYILIPDGVRITTVRD